MGNMVKTRKKLIKELETLNRRMAGDNMAEEVSSPSNYQLKTKEENIKGQRKGMK